MTATIASIPTLEAARAFRVATALTGPEMVQLAARMDVLAKREGVAG